MCSARLVFGSAGSTISPLASTRNGGIYHPLFSSLERCTSTSILSSIGVWAGFLERAQASRRMSQERLGEQACIRCNHARLQLVHTLRVIIAFVSRDPFSRTLFLQIIFPFPFCCFLFELVDWVGFDSGSTSISNPNRIGFCYQ